MVSDKKIAIMGIDNAGKSSIVLAMKAKFEIPDRIKGLTPTKHIERSSIKFLNHIIYQSDYGGQKRYRDEYLQYKERYLAGIDLLFYVIDVQDNLRFDESFEYFNTILTYFMENNENIPVMIFLHKIDPNLRNDPTIRDNIEKILDKIRPWQSKFKIRYEETTIYEIQTIIRAFSRGIGMLYSAHEAVNNFILDLVEKMENVLALLIFEENGIELGSYFMEHLPLPMRKKILTLYEIAQKRISEADRDTYEFSDRLDAFTKVSGVIQSFQVDNFVFYVLLVLEEHSEEIVIDQLNFFEQSYVEIYEILKALLMHEE